MQDIKDFLCDRKREYEQEQRAKNLLEDEPDREDVKSDLNHVVKLQDRYNSLIEFIDELLKTYL